VYYELKGFLSCVLSTPTLSPSINTMGAKADFYHHFNWNA